MINIDRTLKKLHKLKEKYADSADPSDNEQIAEWEEDVKRAGLLANLATHDGFKMIVKKLLKDIKDMDVLLRSADSKTLPDRERDRVIDRKALYEWFTGLLVDNPKVLSSIEDEVDEGLKKVGVDSEKVV